MDSSEYFIGLMDLTIYELT